MIKQLFFFFITLFFTLSASAEEPKTLVMAGIEFFYDNCENLNFEEHAEELMNFDSRFDSMHLYLIERHREEASFDKKNQCLLKISKTVYPYYHQQLTENKCDDMCFQYLWSKKDPLAMKEALKNYLAVRHEPESNDMLSYMLHYLLYYEYFYITNTVGVVDLKDQPTSGARTIQSLKNGTPIRLLNRTNNWWHIALQNNKTGYIDDASISVEKPSDK